jgi:hypothetical protein
MIRTFVSELESKLAERDESALGTTREEVEKFIAEVNEVRENAWYAINELKEQLKDADYDTAHKLQALITQQLAIFEAAIESALTQMESVIEQMQDAQDSAFEMAKNALSTTLANKRTAFHASLDRDEASFNDALNHNMNAFNESIAAQRAAFENSLAEKQAAFDAAKERKLKQIHFVQDSNYKFHLIKLLEAKSAAITQAIGTARQGFSDVLNEEAQRFSERREAERVLFDEARAAMREAFADEEVEIEQELNNELEQLNEAFDAALDELSTELGAGLSEQKELFKTALEQEEAYVEDEYVYTEHAAPAHNYSPYSHSAKNQFLAEFHYYLSDQLKKLDAGIDAIAEWTQMETDTKVEAFNTAVAFSEQRLGDRRVMAQETLAQLADSLAAEYAAAQDMEITAVKEKRAGLEEAIAGKAEELKKKIVYLKKQLHFNGHATDFEEYSLSEAIDAMVGEFDNAVQQIRDWFQSNMEVEIEESTARANAAGVAFTDAIQKLMQDLATLAGELAQAARDGAIATEEWYVNETQVRLDGFQHVIAALTEKVEGWYQEKLVWIGGLHDHYYAEELRGKLESKKQQAYAALEDRANAAQEVV